MIVLIYDITNEQRATKTAESISKHSLAELKLMSPAELKSLSDTWQPHMNVENPLLIRVMHITTSGDGCQSYFENGLLPPLDVLSIDTELSRFSKDRFSITINADGKPCRGNEELHPLFDSALLNKLKDDNRINGYAYCNGEYEEYDVRPEILEDMYRFFAAGEQSTSSWAKGKLAYCIMFDAICYEVATITDATMEEYNDLYDFYYKLLVLALDVALGQRRASVCVTLRPGLRIEANRLTIRKLSQSDCANNRSD